MTRHLPFDRPGRVGDEIHRVVAEAILTGLSDPRLAGVTITRVRMTRDLRTAYCYFHLADAAEETRQTARTALHRSRGFLKRRIGESVKLKFMPEIEFFYDEGVDAEQRIEELLTSVTRNA